MGLASHSVCDAQLTQDHLLRSLSPGDFLAPLTVAVWLTTLLAFGFISFP